MEFTAAAIAAGVRRGALTARSATEQALTRIEVADDAVGAFQEVRVFKALHEADAVDALAEKSSLPLAGVPIAIKDNVAVAGEPTRSGSMASDSTPQTEDHAVVARLRAAGAVVVGITRAPELCLWGTTDSAFGVTHNPWDLTRTPGGSSGGSAAAVAAGMVPIAHATDSMGSTRIPAACCGLVGIKPGLGVVPSGLGNGSWFDMGENGTLATTVQDAALMLSVMAGRPELAQLPDPGVLRVAASRKVPVAGTPLDKEWADAVQDTSVLLREAGHSVRRADPPYRLSTQLSEATRWFAGSELDARLLADRSALEARTRRHAALGRAVLRMGLPKEGGRTRWQEAADRFFADFDVLVTPALAQLPIRSIAWSDRGWFRNFWANARYAPFAAPWNLAGWPALVLPAGMHSGGLPLAVQLVARPGGEALLLGVAAQLERLRPWQRTAADPSARSSRRGPAEQT